MTDRKQGFLTFHAERMLAEPDRRLRDFHGRMLAKRVHAARRAKQAMDLMAEINRVVRNA